MGDRQGNTTEPDAGPAASSGIEGLDKILRGGFPRDEIHIVQGGAGTGKTTLALHYLLAGTIVGESGLYITLSQTRGVLDAIARSHGWSLTGLIVHEVSPERMGAHQTVLHTAELELGELTAELREVVEQSKPRRAVIDSIGVLGLLAGSPSRYRREVMSFRQFLLNRGCTTLFIADLPTGTGWDASFLLEFQTLASSITHLEQVAPDYGEVRRRVQVSKVRGVSFQGGYHYFRIKKGGSEVYPRLGPSPTVEYKDFESLPSGIKTLDALLGGGLERGTTCLMMGPPGAGKSILAGAFALSAANRGEPVAIFLFDERPETWKSRSAGVGMDLSPHVNSGRLVLQQLEPAQITPGEFAQRVREAAEDRGARTVVIDSLTGYFNAMGNTPLLVVQMHELLTFLSRHGVLTFLLVTQEGLMSIGSRPALDVSYLSDSIILLQLFEADAAVRRCLSAIKKRQGEHETSIRELLIRPGSVTVGEEPLREFRNLLSGHPTPAGAGRGRGDGGSNADQADKLRDG